MGLLTGVPSHMRLHGASWVVELSFSGSGLQLCCQLRHQARLQMLPDLHRSHRADISAAILSSNDQEAEPLLLTDELPTPVV